MDEKVVGNPAKIKHRFERDEKHLLEFIKSKDEEFKKYEDLKNAEQAIFNGKAEIVKLITDADEFREGIEKGHVELQHL